MSGSSHEAALRSLTPPVLDQVDRQCLADYFVNTWDLYEWLFSAIHAEGALYQNPDPLRQPLIFYLGHTAVFYVNKLKLAGLIDAGLNDRFERLFAVGVDPATTDELGEEAWPSESELRQYRHQVFDLVLDQIAHAEIRHPISAADPLWSLLMGLEHDRIHFETSSVLIRQYPVEHVERPEGWEYAPASGAQNAKQLIEIPGGQVVLGKSTEIPTFGWDSDYGHLEVTVADFMISGDLVTNAQFLEFVQDRGYERPELWSDEGWTWKVEASVHHPRFWVPRQRGHSYRAMFDELEMPSSWPAEVNALEAEAFCKWKGPEWRLPSESEFARVAQGAPMVDGDCAFSEVYNLDLVYGSPTPVGFMTDARTEHGVNDLFGNVWEWLSDDFHSLPGYETHYLYRDFSEPFMDSDHRMLAGGAWASSGMGASRFYRLWFRRYFYQHAGFRLARDA